MSFYDSGIGRSKPPLSSHQPPQQSSYDDYNNNNNEYLSALAPTNEVVVVHLLPNNNNTVAQIACIILSSDLQEKESFFFNYSVHDSFSQQADYIHSSLNNRIWIVTDEYSVAQLLDQSFKAVNKSAPQPSRLINATEIFNTHKVFKSQSMITASCSARTACNDTYATLQRIALITLLSPTSNVPTQTMQSVIETREYNSSTNEALDAPLNDENVQQWTRSTNNNNNNNNDNIIEMITNEISRDNNNNEATYNETAYNMNEDTQQTMDEQQVTQTVIEEVAEVQQPTNTIITDEAQAQQVFNATEASTTNTTQQTNGFHDNPEHEIMETQNDNDGAQDAEQAQTPQDYRQDIEEAVTSQTEEEEQRSVKSETFVHSHAAQASMSSSPASQQADVSQKVAASSWAAKFKTKKTTSPKRRALGVVDHVSDNIYGIKVRGSKYAATKSADGIRNSIDAAIKKKDIIWVSYNGHQKPFIPRAIRPQAWDNTKQKELSFFAIQHKSKSQTKQRFYLKNVLEVRDKQWRISNIELEQLKKQNLSYNNSNYTRRGYGGTSKNFQNKRPRAYNNNPNNQ